MTLERARNRDPAYDTHMTLHGEHVLLRGYFQSADRTPHTPTYERLVAAARKEGLAGATVIQGISGFGPSSILHEAHPFRLSADLPVVIEVVDAQERLDTVLPEVDRMMTGGLVTLEKVRVLRYEKSP